MTGTPSILADLLTECDARGIRLHPVGDGGLTIDAPQAALTPNMVARLKADKAELLALLRLAPAVEPQTMPTMKPTTKPVCRCGSTVWRDVPIHDGQSVRRDCDNCGRFIKFPV
ncbi:MAG: hypothetical protein A2V70_14835 [Planctomycetes bacterium RBG_13_63_9]|nr:MAG: hypothetical protein A2V70_14835 [Planctomycetes bacterium RBG_13_63_9]